ncbi:MAG: outer membrane lipoprotein carrier protein LolA [Rikenellaceae bacterium]
MFRAILIFILALSANTLSAQSEESFESRIERFSSQNERIECDFTQTKKVKNITNTIIARGEFFYDNSGLMALRYSEPKGDKIIINRERFTVVTSGRVIEGVAEDNPMMMQICNMLQASMSGDVNSLGRGWQMETTDNATQYIVILTPSDRRTKRYIESLVMLFSKRDMTLDELRMNETSGGYTLYEFSNKEINGTIDPKMFE